MPSAHAGPSTCNPTQSKPVQDRFFLLTKTVFFFTGIDCPKPGFTEVAQTGAEPVRLLAKPVQHRFFIHRFQTGFYQQKFTPVQNRYRSPG